MLRSFLEFWKSLETPYFEDVKLILGKYGVRMRTESISFTIEAVAGSKNVVMTVWFP